eukprot:CAMPEP_0197592326 /NCGR_PEP_ID=MMETSP1326-20131121/15031_1 /TAXON_ID=1155430 /ORGANISM="Genus nov. species nov., Strain RCC2288" /LENGTH=70 /DNA_ID=CAMNT_0043158013 /DNA_START=45 /DNA_END=257 /DNA_ORIENTATION=+
MSSTTMYTGVSTLFTKPRKSRQRTAMPRRNTALACAMAMGFHPKPMSLSAAGATPRQLSACASECFFETE